MGSAAGPGRNEEIYYNKIMKTILSALTLASLFSSAALAGPAVSFDQKGDIKALSENLKADAKTTAASGPGGVSAAKGPGFCVFNGASGAPIGDTFNAVVGAADVVYGGETHDQLNDHLAQLEALKALGLARGEKIVVGFEMLNMTLQPVLEDYAAGKLTDEEFMAKADWKTEWGFDFNLYKPIFDYIRANKLKALALNLPKKVVSKIARVGLAGLSPEEKQYLPAKVEVTKNEAYIKFIRDSFENHGKAMGEAKTAPQKRALPGRSKAGMGDFTFENYLAAMSAWNESMGSRLADFLNANPGYAGMTIAGAGHVIYNAGIPASVASRTSGLRAVSFYPVDAEACPAAFPAADAGLADYVWYIPHAAPAPGVKK